jgi:hypothetical protein
MPQRALNVDTGSAIELDELTLPPFSARLVTAPLTHPNAEPADPALHHYACGVANAMRVDMISHFTPGWTPRCLDERRWPLCDVGASVTSFDWTSRRVDVPPFAKVHELVWLLVVRLNMSVGDLVYALILFETCVRDHPGLLALHNVRRLYLTCCSLSVKITQDAEVQLSAIWNNVCDVFSALKMEELSALERQVLTILGYRLPQDVEIFSTYAHALNDAANEATGPLKSLSVDFVVRMVDTDEEDVPMVGAFVRLPTLPVPRMPASVLS